MKNKKLLLVATAALGVAALGTAGVGTAAWFVAQEASVQVGTRPATGDLTAIDNSVNAGNVVLDFAWNTKSSNDVYFTHTDGTSAYYVGEVNDANKVTIASNDASLSGHKTGTYTYTVSLHENYSSQVLASAAGTYTVTFGVTGAVKIGSDEATAIAGSGYTASVTIASTGITAGDSGTVYFGFVGLNSDQGSSKTGTITIGNTANKAVNP